MKKQHVNKVPEITKECTRNTTLGSLIENFDPCLNRLSDFLETLEHVGLRLNNCCLAKQCGDEQPYPETIFGMLEYRRDRFVDLLNRLEDITKNLSDNV